MMPSDRPEDRIIEDDVELDKWWLQYQRESARKAGRQGPMTTNSDAVRSYQG